MPMERQTLNSLNTFDFQHINGPVAVDDAAIEGRGGVSLGGFLPPLLSSNSPYRKEIFTRQTEFIIKPSAEKRRKFNVQTILRNVRKCREGNFVRVACKSCKNELSPTTIRLTCQNRFCSCPDCVEMRRLKAFGNLERLKVRSKSLIHLIVGFERIIGESKDKKKQREEVLSSIKIELEKCGIKLHAVSVWDMNVHEKKGFKFFYMHYHLALLPVKDFRCLMLAVRKVQEKFKGIATIRNEGYKPKKSLFNYFAKIQAGLVSTEEEHHTVTYSKILTIQEFREFFYHKRMLRKWALSSVSCVLHDTSGREYMFKLLGISLPKKCPFCGCELSRANVFLKKITEEEKPPNPDAKKYFIVQNWISKNSYEEMKIEFGVSR